MHLIYVPIFAFGALTLLVEHQEEHPACYSIICCSVKIQIGFWVAVCKTIRPMLSVLSVCDVGLLWPNGWMDQDET